mmetsp:Transcript_12842/g.53964  ORF Transcript_12842/g.53964 Transcript_12842/m.53964 type:complete len:211 (-) Transcript_12842:760-1392(-)
MGRPVARVVEELEHAHLVAHGLLTPVVVHHPVLVERRLHGAAAAKVQRAVQHATGGGVQDVHDQPRHDRSAANAGVRAALSAILVVLRAHSGGEDSGRVGAEVFVERGSVTEHLDLRVHGVGGALHDCLHAFAGRKRQLPQRRAAHAHGGGRIGHQSVAANLARNLVGLVVEHFARTRCKRLARVGRGDGIGGIATGHTHEVQLAGRANE